MGDSTGFVSQFRLILRDDPLLALALSAALFAFATTPIAFAVLGRMEWFRARRGRVLQRPEFASIVAAMVLVMGIPAIFALLALKSRHYDESRYEFDPNQTISVLDQGRQYRTLKEADEAVRVERQRLEAARQSLVESVKSLDESMLALRAAASLHPATYQTLPKVLDSVAVIHKQIGLDAPQQLLDELAPPADLPPTPAYAMIPPGSIPPAWTGSVTPPAPANAGPPRGGIGTAAAQAELATVPPPQRAVAAMLPLDDIEPGWVVGEMGGKHLETFNAENLYEKIDGRAESFIQYDVVGMAYTYFHPEGDDSTEAQLYIFELASPLKAFGKYSSEKPPEAEAVALGDDGYISAGSVFFYSGPYYTQVVLNTEDEKLAAFALEVARTVARRQNPATAEPAPLAGAGGSSPPAAIASETVTESPTPTAPATTAEPAPAETAANAPPTPAQLFKLLPAQPTRSGETYASQDVFGYAFLSDVFLADYKKDDDTYWQGFLRPFSSPEAAAEVLDQYLAAVKEYGGEVEDIKAEGADRMAVCSLYGLYDAVFIKGNTLAGANGSTDREAVVEFSLAFARSLPDSVPSLDVGKADSQAASSTDEEGS